MIKGQYSLSIFLIRCTTWLVNGFGACVGIPLIFVGELSCSTLCLKKPSLLEMLFEANMIGEFAGPYSSA